MDLNWIEFHFSDEEFSKKRQEFQEKNEWKIIIDFEFQPV